MSDQNAQEPTMEEILASIRRIISEDDAPADDAAPAEAEAAASAPAAAVAQEPVPEPESPAPAFAASDAEDDVLDLTDPIAPPANEVHGDLDIYTAAAEPAPAPAAAPAPAPPPMNLGEGLVGDVAARASASAFNSLAAAITMPAAGRTLEDVVRELLKPLLSAWLDEHLPRIVETKVEEEVQRIARGR